MCLRTKRDIRYVYSVRAGLGLTAPRCSLILGAILQVSQLFHPKSTDSAFIGVPIPNIWGDS
jgi:hypothetical protein